MVTALLQMPTWGLWAELDTKEKGGDGDEGRTKVGPPSDAPSVL